MLNRLQKRGPIREYADKEDKRSKRLELTVKGERIVAKGLDKIMKNANMPMHGLSDDDEQLCIQLLKGV